jgi:hypothetical protein
MLIAATDPRQLQDTAFTDRDAVVAVKTDIPGVVKNILWLLPETSNVAVVLGNSLLEKFWLQELRRELQPFTNRISFLWFNELSFEKMLKRAAALPPRSAIFYGLLLVDADGVPHEEDRALANLHAVANAPIFGAFDSQLGLGIVGGAVVSAQELSRVTAGVAVRILRGESRGVHKDDTVGTGTTDVRLERTAALEHQRIQFAVRQHRTGP